jgi:hypothetical protein
LDERNNIVVRPNAERNNIVVGPNVGAALGGYTHFKVSLNAQ